MSMKESGLEVFFEALVTSDLSSAIMAQEAQGQQKLVNSTALPKKGLERELFEQMGVVIGDDIDDLFIEAQLPKGWRKVATNHAMWSKLLDEQGRERASIFYKAAFYDRDAHISLMRRFSCRVEPVRGWDANYKQSEWWCEVYDGDVSIWQSESIEAEPEYNLDDSEAKRAAWLRWQERKSALGELGKAWLDEHYPDWNNPLAYWDA